jgi:hypothetical protein
VQCRRKVDSSLLVLGGWVAEEGTVLMIDTRLVQGD